jgi:2-oxoglutarate dehydrogenase E1 component
MITSTQFHRNGPRGTVGNASQAEFLEEQYTAWKNNPSSVDATWSAFFEGFEIGLQLPPPPRATQGGTTTITASAPPAIEAGRQRLRQARIYNLLFAYRTLGHIIAHTDPLGFNKETLPDLDLQAFGFSDADLDDIFDSGTLAGGGEKSLREILQILKETYCGTIGVEYMHTQDQSLRRWLRNKMESCRNRPDFSTEKKRRILTHLMEAETFERFLHKRYVGQKRFSLEGGETLIPMLDAIVENAHLHGISQIVMGMAHRGRLNVLANILGKDFQTLFSEFSENYVPNLELGDGDVKYHLGFDATVMNSAAHRIGISLAPNPSHLELVDPVVQGKARAWQRLLNDTQERSRVLPILIHGDAAFAGQGIVMETLNLSQLEGYRTGGTIHIIINNQIGFTTTPQDARSTRYCTGVAKMLGVPIFHINGDDPLSAVYTVELALEYRQKFHRDIVLDLVCYRRHGHNEGDEPSFTQPTLYTAIKDHPSPSHLLMRRLIEEDPAFQKEIQEWQKIFDQRLEEALTLSREKSATFRPAIRPPISTPALLEKIPTTPTQESVAAVAKALTHVPPSHNTDPKITRLLQQRAKMYAGEIPLDWAAAELLAFGTLLHQGIPVRLSGQDSRRGTFSQRHCVIYDTKTRERYIPLKNISPDQATFCVYNSPLSEAAVLGFDFGYTLDYPKMLCIWEAQFGDFANGAQAVIDQYITSSESKWGVTSGIVLMLPHGYHGQGPEHSSARLERFLQACAEDNIQVANCTTPAQHFHILRRQALREIKKPLILMTPKGLLRYAPCSSPINDILQGHFHEILPDPALPAGAKKVILCSGKVYYDLIEYREKHTITDAAIIRIEQLYPLHRQALTEALNSHPGATVTWCQEESQNMGPWSYISPILYDILGAFPAYAGRDASASPATGSDAIHKLEQADLVQRAFA